MATRSTQPTKKPAPNVLPLAERLIENARAAGETRLLKMPPLCDLSARLRQYLKWAGVTRAELFANDKTRKQITFHDLRATGITWMAIRGDEPQKIMHRAGHENMSTTMGYIREAEALEYLRTDVFPALPEGLFLPDILPEGPAIWATLRKDYYLKRPQRDSAHADPGRVHRRRIGRAPAVAAGCRVGRCGKIAPLRSPWPSFQPRV